MCWDGFSIISTFTMSASTSVDPSGAAQGQSEASYFFANKIGRIVYLALEEAAGSESLRAILSAVRMKERLDGYPPNNFAAEFSFEELGTVQRAMDELYGPRTGRRLARRTGEACFRIGAEDMRPVLGLADLLFRILPLQMRARIGFEVLAHAFNRFSDHLVHLEEDEHHFRWVTERCGVCWGRTTDAPCCDLIVGLLEEALYWLSGGANFFIEESSCIAAGDPTCTILIGKHPLVESTLPED